MIQSVWNWKSEESFLFIFIIIFCFIFDGRIWKTRRQYVWLFCFYVFCCSEFDGCLSFRRRHRREYFVIGHGEIVVAHQRVARRVLAVVRVRQVAVTVHVDVAVVGDQQVGAGPEYRPCSVMNVDGLIDYYWSVVGNKQSLFHTFYPGGYLLHFWKRRGKPNMKKSKNKCLSKIFSPLTIFQKILIL